MSPNVANELSEISLTPPHKPIIHNNNPVNPAVLKLGCFKINKINELKEIIEIIFLFFLTNFQCAKRLDASRIKKGFMSSDGCNRKLPSSNHLEDPLTVIPLILVSNIKKNKK